METRIWFALIAASILFALGQARPTAHAQQPQPTPTVDRLAIPTLPAHPTQLETGKSLYYYHCMPCHGDYGQGLTEEFRGIWEQDHQNCWGRGCHGGRPNDGGFPIPTVVPAVNDMARIGRRFPAEADLYAYLKATHPPQYPGKLKDDEYRALSAYVLAMGRATTPAPSGPAQGFAAQLAALAAGATALLLAWIAARSALRPREPGA